MIILSILLPTTPDRSEMFGRLYSELMSQHSYMKTFHPTLGEIEIIYNDADRFLDGGLSIGDKRQALLEAASGKYICYLDSDDLIAPNYLETLVRLCQYDNDVCTFVNLTKTDGYWTIINMRLGQENEDAGPGKIVKRSPWHICPIRRKIAKQYVFANINYGEDWKWLNRVLAECKTESHSEFILHQYNHSSKTSEADKIIKAGYA